MYGVYVLYSVYTFSSIPDDISKMREEAVTYLFWIKYVQIERRKKERLMIMVISLSITGLQVSPYLFAFVFQLICSGICFYVQSYSITFSVSLNICSLKRLIMTFKILILIK